MDKADWRGWVIRATDWHAPLFVQGEMPPGHIGWTGKIEDALGFKKKREALEWMEKFPPHEAPKWEARFYPWRTQRRRVSPHG